MDAASKEIAAAGLGALAGAALVPVVATQDVQVAPLPGAWGNASTLVGFIGGAVALGAAVMGKKAKLSGAVRSFVGGFGGALVGAAAVSASLSPAAAATSRGVQSGQVRRLIPNMVTPVARTPIAVIGSR